MSFLYDIILIFAAACVFIELATSTVLGRPVLRRKDAETDRKLLPIASLNSYDKKILNFWPEKGLVSSCGFSLFGTLYYSDYKRRVRIPWWTPLYKEVKAKYAELNRLEK